MRYCLITTEIGDFGLIWAPAGLRRVLLPGQSRAAMIAQMIRSADPASTPQLPRFLMDAVEAYGRGEEVDFSATQLDLSGVPDFHRAVYADILALGWGRTTTYGEIAKRLGDLAHSRAVGQALGKNPVPLIVPCHRVLANGGRVGGFSAPGGAAAKLRMLALEGIEIVVPPTQLAFGF